MAFSNELNRSASSLPNDSLISGSSIKSSLDTIYNLYNRNSIDNVIDWEDHGVVVDNGFNAYYPTLIYDARYFDEDNGPKFKCWYSYGGGTSIRLITSNDAISWSAPVALTGFTTNAHHAHVVYNRSGFGSQSDIKYKMWYWDSGVATYTIDRIRYAESIDGINWVNDQAVTQDATYKLISGNFGDWNASTWGFQKVFYQGNAKNTGTNPWDYNYVAYYDANTGTTYQTTGLAYSVDGISWFNRQTQPTLNRSYDNVAAWDYYSASFGSIIRDINGFHFWYTGGIFSGNTDNYGIGYAHSEDGFVWMRDSSNPIFSVIDGQTYRDERCYTPSIVDDGYGTLYMFYTAQGTAQTGRKKLALATLKY